jgi:hypothetical protein
MHKIVKFIKRDSRADEEFYYKKQLPNNSNVWKNCEFTFNPLNRKYDWLVIVDDIPKILKNGYEVLSCPDENTILLTTEPSPITRYGRAFANQFEYLITNQEKEVLPHKNATRSHTGNVWLYGKTYDEILKDTVSSSFKKKKKISTICSNKQMGHTIHKLRFDFTKRLQEECPEITRCGWGFNPIDNKFDAIDDYEFHVCIENHIAPHVWTEKLADAFLGYSIPIYYGCPNIYDYFPEDSIILIDLNNFDESITKIKKIINTPGEYEKRFSALQEARRRILEEYNIFEMISQIINNTTTNCQVSNKKIFNRRIMRAKYLPDLIRFIKFRINNYLVNKKS